jgi:hypothetical protein
MERALHVRWIVTIGATVPSDGSLQGLLSSLIYVSSQPVPERRKFKRRVVIREWSGERGRVRL